MLPKDWKIFRHYTDYSSAQLAAGKLDAEGIPVLVESDILLPGLNREYRILIPAIFEDQATQIVQQNQITEEELEFLAMDNNQSSKKI